MASAEHGPDGAPYISVYLCTRQARAGQPALVLPRAKAAPPCAPSIGAALANGGTDDGPPGIREIYSPDYYAAFVRDPDGNRIEAVTRRPEE